ncbi:hypothetical protein [Nocardia sp. NPDC049526]|uniref:hypothetical protein n=1 Tax=Nocardia sp. NPDC049526 TaxID=3364316 RepID=UPI00379549AD
MSEVESTQRATAAAEMLNAFSNQLVDELDVTGGGGFPWWNGYSDWKTLALIADYLIQSVAGAGDALNAASFTASEHRQAVLEDDAASQAAIRNAVGITPQQRMDSYFALAHDRTRVLRADLAAEHCFFHMGRVLDRVAAALVIIGGFAVKDVVKTDWTQIETLAADLSASSAKQCFAPLGSLGRQWQLDLIGPVLNPEKFGPEDWVVWMRETRNSMTHRAPSTQLRVLTEDGSLMRPFYRQPKWSELQTMVYPTHSEKRDLTSAFLFKCSQDVLDGLVCSLAAIVTELAQSMKACWARRKATPGEIIQHGSQWRSVQPTAIAERFPGYGHARCHPSLVGESCCPRW